jgi:hypothetical protein
MSEDIGSAGLRAPLDVPFVADSERSVSGAFQLWFRNGNGRGASSLHQSKIYTESKQWGFSANFRQVNFNGNTCDLLRPASQE